MPFYSMIKSMQPRKRLRFFRVAAWICLGLGIILIGVQVLMSWIHLSTYQHYIPHQAIITESEIHTRLDDGKRRYDGHDLVYEYQYLEKTYTGSEYIKQGEVKTNAAELDPGVKIRIFLNPEKPEEAQINIQPDVFMSYGMLVITMLISYFVIYQLSVRRIHLGFSYLIMLPIFALTILAQWQINLYFFPHEKEDATVKLFVLIGFALLYMSLPFPLLGKFIRKTEEELMELKLKEMTYQDAKPQAPAMPVPTAEAPEQSSHQA